MFLHDNSRSHASKTTTAKLPEYIYRQDQFWVKLYLPIKQ